MPAALTAYFLLKRILPGETLRQAVELLQKAGNWRRFGDWHGPRSIGISINDHCNRACSYCPQSVKTVRNPERFVEDAVFKQFLKRLQEINWAYAVDYHFYGEPMLHPNLESLIRQTVEASPRAKPRVFTNGDFLTEEKLLDLVNAGVFCLNVSRHPPYRDEWDQRIRRLLDKYSQYVRCNDPSLRELSNRGGLVQPKISDQAQMWRDGCYAPSVNLGVSSRGDYLFCCADYLEKNALGNIFEHSIVEAWQREPFKTHRENARKSNPTLPLCKACFGPKPRLETY